MAYAIISRAPPIIDDRQSKGIQSIEQGFRLLKHLQDANGPLPLKDLAAGAAMSPSTAHFYLSRYGDRQQRLDELSADPGIQSQLVGLQLPT